MVLRKPNCFIFHCNVQRTISEHCTVIGSSISSYINDASQTDIAEKDEEGNSIDQDEPDIGGEITPQSSEIMKPPEQPKKG
ncbi:hypothetical protein TNCV_4794631 [Trichonephila clavipes]|nr:hypothetical protein TNCV_4794631 [Trichonephila clavipes]